MAQRVMKWDGFNILQPQNMTTSTVGYGDLAPSNVQGGLRAIRSSTSEAPNTYIKSTTDQQKAARILWQDINTRGTGNQKNTGAFQLRLWFYASNGFKTIPTGYHYRFVRAYDYPADEWIACLCYKGKDLVLRTGADFGKNADTVVWKNALSDSGWANKWHRIEISCNPSKNQTGVRIDKRGWVNSDWVKRYIQGPSGGGPVLKALTVGAVEADSPNNVSFRNIEILDSYSQADFTYDWIPPVGPGFSLPASIQVEREIEVATVNVQNAALGGAPLKSAKWFRETTDPETNLTVRVELKSENVSITDFNDFKLERGPYTEEQTEKIVLVVEDQNNFKIEKFTNIYVGATADTGPEISVSDKNILLGQGTVVQIMTTSAGTNGAIYYPNIPIVRPQSGEGGIQTEVGILSSDDLLASKNEIKSYSLYGSGSNPGNPDLSHVYTRTGTGSWPVITLNFGVFSKAGTYSYEFSIKNNKGISSSVSFDVVVDGVDEPVWTFNSPPLPNEYDEYPEYYLNSEFDIDIDVDMGNAGAPIYNESYNNLAGTSITNGTFTYIEGTTYKFTGIGHVDDLDSFMNGLSIGITDSLGNSNVSPMVFYNGRQVVAPIISLTPDFLVNAQITQKFTIEVFITDGTFEIDPETVYWDILEAPAGYDGAVLFDTYFMTFEDYDTAGNYTFRYTIEDVEGNEYEAFCNVYISMGSSTEPDAPRDPLDWMSNIQLEHEAMRSLSGIEMFGNNKQMIEWYRRQVLSLQIPNIDSMSYEEVERQYFKAIINGDLERQLSLYGVLDGGNPDSVITDDDIVDPDEKDTDDEDDIPVPPNPPEEPDEPEIPAPVVISFDHIVNLKHNQRRVLQSFAWDQGRDVWYGAQVNPDSTNDTLMYKFDSTGAYLGTQNHVAGGHGSSIAYQRVGSVDYIYNFYEALGMDKAYRGPARVKYTNGSSVTPPSANIERLPTFYGTSNTTMNLYGEYITTKVKASGKETFRLYKLTDYLGGNNKPISVISYDHVKANLPAYQGHAADEKYLYVHRGGNYFDKNKPDTLWDKPYLMVYEWKTGKVRTVDTFDVGYDISSGKSEAEGVQRYDVGGVKYIYIGKITGKIGARVQNVYRFKRDEMEAWFAQNG